CPAQGRTLIDQYQFKERPRSQIREGQKIEIRERPKSQIKKTPTPQASRQPGAAQAKNPHRHASKPNKSPSSPCNSAKFAHVRDGCHCGTSMRAL
ncbi:hypothetical protein PQQ63_34655, partial [Paraburkholderia metrosideri]